MIFIDSNIFISYFEKRDEIISRRVEKLFSDITEGRLIAYTSNMVIAEIIWVLDRIYKWNREEICDNIEFILNTPNIKIKDKALLADSIILFRENNVDFIDCYNYSLMKIEKIEEILTFDKDFEKIGARRREP